MYEHDHERPHSSVLAGWHIYSRDGESLGEVIGADADRFLIRGQGPYRLQLSTDTIVEQDQDDMCARISIATAEVEQIATRIPAPGHPLRRSPARKTKR